MDRSVYVMIEEVGANGVRDRRRNEKWGREMQRWSVIWRRGQHLRLFCFVWVYCGSFWVSWTFFFFSSVRNNFSL